MVNLIHKYISSIIYFHAYNQPTTWVINFIHQHCLFMISTINLYSKFHFRDSLVDSLTFHLSINNCTFIVSLINAKNNCAFKIVHCLTFSWSLVSNILSKHIKINNLQKWKMKKLFFLPSNKWEGFGSPPPSSPHFSLPFTPSSIFILAYPKVTLGMFPCVPMYFQITPLFIPS